MPGTFGMVIKTMTTQKTTQKTLIYPHPIPDFFDRTCDLMFIHCLGSGYMNYFCFSLEPCGDTEWDKLFLACTRCYRRIKRLTPLKQITKKHYKYWGGKNAILRTCRLCQSDTSPHHKHGICRACHERLQRLTPTSS